MCALFVNAVAGRIAKFPLGVRCGVGAGRAQKTVSGGQNPCNITWDYVAWMGRRRGSRVVYPIFFEAARA